MSLFSVDLPQRFTYKSEDPEMQKQELEDYLNELSRSLEDMFRRLHSRQTDTADSPTSGNILKTDEDGGLVDSGETLAELCHLAGEETITGEKTFSKFPISPSAAPDANYEFANKKYVDEEIAAIPAPSDEDEKVKMQLSQTDAEYLEEFTDEETVFANLTTNKLYIKTRMKVGSYDGDGNNSQAITGVGFQPDVVMVFIGTPGNSRRGVSTSTMAGYTAVWDASFRYGPDMIASLDADGFTVGDGTGGGSVNFNVSGNTYHWIAWKGE